MQPSLVILKSDASPPVTLTLIVAGTFTTVPEIVSVRPEGLKINQLLKLIDVTGFDALVLSVTVGEAADTPVPVRVKVWGDGVKLPERDNVAVSGPVVVGAYLTVTVPLEDTEPVKVLADTVKSDDPEIEAPDPVDGPVATVTTSFKVGELPSTTLPNARFPGDTEMVGLLPAMAKLHTFTVS